MKASKLIALLSALLLVIVIIMLPPTAIAQSSQSSEWSDTAVVMLTRDQEPNATAPMDDMGPQGIAVLEMNTSQVCYQVWAYNVSNLTQAHIHMGQPGEEGPVVAWLYPSNKADQANASMNSTNMPGNFTGLVAMGNITSSDLVGPMEGMSISDLNTGLNNGSMYVNVHTTQNPGGEVRGQVDQDSIWNKSLAVPMTPLEVPTLNYTDSRWNISSQPSMMEQHGLANLVGMDLKSTPWGIAVVQPSGSMVHWAIWTFGITNVTQAHFHMGPPGQEGSVVAWMYPASDATAPANLTSSQMGKVMNGKLIEGNTSDPDLLGPLMGMQASDLVTAMGNGSIYVNVHTTQNPGGEIRGQIDPANMTCGMKAQASSSSSNSPSQNPPSYAAAP